jgi:hypothetical protein
MAYKIIKNNYYKLLIYILILLLLLMLYLGSNNLVEGNTCMDTTDSVVNGGLLNIISCSKTNNIPSTTTVLDMSSICTNNVDNTINNIIEYGGLGNPASNLLNSSGQLLSNAANARGLC